MGRNKKKSYIICICITIFLVICLLCVCIIMYTRKSGQNCKFKVWIEIDKVEFYENEDIDIHLYMEYIGDEEVEIYGQDLPFTLLISGDNNFKAKLEPVTTFSGKRLMNKGDRIHMDCSMYGGYQYFSAMQLLPETEKRDIAKIGLMSSLTLPPGDYTFDLTSWYYEDEEQNTKKELYDQQLITVNHFYENRPKILETKLDENFYFELIINKDIFSENEYIWVYSLMEYIGEESLSFLDYSDFLGYPLDIVIYNSMESEVQIEKLSHSLIPISNKVLDHGDKIYFFPYSELMLPKGEYTIVASYMYPDSNGISKSTEISAKMQVIDD